MVVLLMIGVNCSLFTSKPAHFSRHLPPRLLPGKCAQYSDKNERGRPLCPNIHPNFSWMKVRTDFHGLTFCRRAGHFSRESCNTGFHLLLSSVSFGSG